ncbi:uncharacterized protein LOC103710654 isoform X2 [Phoenix dactylifera]|uniref:Uncharacterized protein LOC103710654 isoform X2 n=1 Tax=Phoenix dactylifera TaxID=42345 RepID=A0A8B8J6H7_PHODC|nr:uncharacterized protein LOC103710654 isoform X2 [Phoenix dactylifera]
MIEQFINFVIRPPRAEYNPDQYLWESEFSFASRKFKRLDLELTNARGHTLQCSHYVPSDIPENSTLPCVIYCHGNSGCRADANEAAVILLPSNITVFTLDFSGSGLSGGDHVSLGWHEKDDLRVVISFLRSNKQVSCIGLWGRSMGAVTSLLYGAEDPSIAGMVLDSAFSNLFDLMMELVDVYKIRLPKFTVKMALQYMRRVIQKKAKFDIMDLNAVQFAPKTFIPALFGHASEDIFIQPHHSDLIYQAYASLLHEIIAGLRAARTNAASSSSAPPSNPNGSTTKSIVELLSESVANMSVNNELDSVIDHDNTATGIGGNSVEESHLQENSKEQNDECCSYTSSNRESWGRCSSLGGASEGSSSAECAGSSNSKSQHMTLKALASPLRRIQWKSSAKLKEKKGSPILRKSKREKLEKGETLGERLRLCFLGRANHKRHRSS